jgi:hypothetical protein
VAVGGHTVARCMSKWTAGQQVVLVQYTTHRKAQYLVSKLWHITGPSQLAVLPPSWWRSPARRTAVHSSQAPQDQAGMHLKQIAQTFIQSLITLLIYYVGAPGTERNTLYCHHHVLPTCTTRGEGMFSTLRARAPKYAGVS